MTYSDFEQTESGLQFQDIRIGDGPAPKNGSRLTLDWSGYTIGYYGRPFEARNKPKGSSFEGGEKDFLKVTLGKDRLIPG